MNTKNILFTSMLLLFSAAVCFNTYQIFQLQRTNSGIHAAVANMAGQVKLFLSPPELPEGIASGTPAFDFSLIDSNNQATSLATLSKEKKKVLIFSSSTCSYCKNYYPEIDKYAKSHEDVEFVVIQAESTPQSNKQFLQDNQYDFKVLVANQEVFSNYQITGTPTTIVLNEDNVVVNSVMASTYNDLANILGD